MSSSRCLALPILSVLALAGAGCGGGDGDDDAPGATTRTPAMVTSAPEGATAPPTTPAETSVPAGRAVLRQNRFKPAEVEAQRGAVTFVNSDDHRHEIVIEGSERPIAVEPGAAATVPAPRKAGTYRLVCRIHEEEGMVGHLVVRPQ